MAVAKAVEVANAVPPLDAAYHSMPAPVAVKLATVGDAPEQKDCVAEPVGATGVVLIVAATANLEVPSQPLTVWLA